jgi:crotonobetainyl-CoA:carnitine CoA-transferase CaiB-like acyl-CoA transferase
MLQDLKVLELASVLAGPSVGQFFAELGAEVIKVENIRTAGDVTRTWRVKGEQTDDRSSYFCAVNWGKKSIAVDLNSPEGKNIVHALTRQSDVVIASFKSGDAIKLQVDYKTLSALNPQLIYGQITGYGSDNPRVGYDAVIQAEAGFMFMNGEPGGASLKMPVALMDILAAHHLKEGILLALLGKHRTGQGEFIEVSLIQAAISSLANQATNWLITGVIPQKQGSMHPNIAPYGDTFTTADNSEILLSIGTDKQFQSLCSILELPELPSGSDYCTNILRVKNRALLNSLLAKQIQSSSMQFLADAFNRANIPYGIIKNLQEVFDTPEAKSLVLSGTNVMGVRTFAANPANHLLSHISPPPHLGEHTREILSQTLEMNVHDLNRLVKDRIVG